MGSSKRNNKIMADAASRKRLKEIRSQNGNNVCCECGKLNPQWISITYGIWVCIECSGKHRLLGLHIGHIKSITMDKWTEKEIEKVSYGGNKNFKEFIESHSSYNSQWKFEEKYQSQLIALYRDKLTMEAAGEIWIEEESPIYLNMKSETTSMSEVKLETPPPETQQSTSEAMLEPIKIVEVEVEPSLDTFSRLGQGFSIATSFVKETTKQAAEELSEFKTANNSLECTTSNVAGAISGWTSW